MADIAASDVTHTLVDGTAKRKNGRYEAVFTVSFGDGALLYPANGVALTKGKLGCPNDLEELVIMDPSSANGFIYKWDRTNNKIRIYQGRAQTHTHDLLLKNAAVADGATTTVNAGANLLGANTGSDLTITGGGANGGVVSTTSAAAALVELGSVAVSAVTLKVKVVGW